MIPLSQALLVLETWHVGGLVSAEHPMFRPAVRAYPEFPQWLAKAQAEERRMYVVTANGIPLGCAILKVEDDKLKLCCLSVADDQQGRGIGSMLMKQFIDDAKDFHLKPYFTSTVDAPASVRRLARKFGFHIMGSAGEDALWVPADA